MIMSLDKSTIKRFLNKTNTCCNFSNAKLADSQNNKSQQSNLLQIIRNMLAN